VNFSAGSIKFYFFYCALFPKLPLQACRLLARALVSRCHHGNGASRKLKYPSIVTQGISLANWTYRFEIHSLPFVKIKTVISISWICLCHYLYKCRWDFSTKISMTIVIALCLARTLLLFVRITVIERRHVRTTAPVSSHVHWRTRGH